MSELYESKKLYTRRREDGMYGLYSRVLFRTGQTILDINSSDKQDGRSLHSIETDAGHFLHPDAMFTNHSCDPSTYVDKKTGLLIAIRNVWPNDEITFDYLASESDIKFPFTCTCGADNCFGKVGTDK